MPSIKPSLGAASLGTLSTGTTAVPPTGWYKLPGAFKTFALTGILGGSTAAVTGTLLLKGKIGASSTASVTLISWSSTLGSSVPKASTNTIPVTHIRVTSTNLASTASTSSAPAPTAAAWLCATP